MTRLLAIVDTWLMMIVGTLFLWFGMTGIYGGNGERDAVIGLLGGIVGICFVGLLCRGRGPVAQPLLMVLRLAMIACLAYFAWFNDRPWFALDDSALVRGSFRQEFLLQRMEQVGSFLLVVVPMVALGIWHGRILPQANCQTLSDRTSVSVLFALVAASVGAGVTARLVGVSKLGLLFWAVGALAIGLLLLEFARRVSKAEFPAFIAFTVFAVAMPVVLMWP